MYFDHGVFAFFQDCINGRVTHQPYQSHVFTCTAFADVYPHEATLGLLADIDEGNTRAKMVGSGRRHRGVTIVGL